MHKPVLAHRLYPHRYLSILSIPCRHQRCCGMCTCGHHADERHTYILTCCTHVFEDYDEAFIVCSRHIIASLLYVRTSVCIPCNAYIYMYIYNAHYSISVSIFPLDIFIYLYVYIYTYYPRSLLPPPVMQLLLLLDICVLTSYAAENSIDQTK